MWHYLCLPWSWIWFFNWNWNWNWVPFLLFQVNYNLYKISNVLACGLTRSRFVSNWEIPIFHCTHSFDEYKNWNGISLYGSAWLGLGESGDRNQMLTFQFVVIKCVINWLKFIIFQVERKPNSKYGGTHSL